MNLKNLPFNVMPFYVEIVDDAGTSVALPLPPYKVSGSQDDMVRLITEQARTGGDPESYAYAVKLLINPATLSINMSKIVNRTQTMTGWLEEHWGEELDTLTFQGTTAAFISGGSYTTYDAGKMAPILNEARRSGYNLSRPGLVASEVRRNSLSYRNFRDLVKIFSTNGIVYDQQGFVSKRYFVQITYDYGCYRGYFESFDITEEASNPYRFSYTITFKAEKTVYRLGTKNWPKPQPVAQDIPSGGGGIYYTMTQLLVPAAITADPVEKDLRQDTKPISDPPSKDPPKPKENKKKETQPSVDEYTMDVITAQGVKRVNIGNWRDPNSQRSLELQQALSGRITNYTIAPSPSTQTKTTVKFNGFQGGRSGGSGASGSF